MHYRRWKRNGDPEWVRQVHQSWAGDDITYGGMHTRLKRMLGRASARPCVDCKQTAAHWSYDGADPNQKRDPKIGYVYSTDFAHYVPRCDLCHARSDGKCKLRDDDVIAIRAAHANGETVSALARKYGVSQPLVSQVVHRSRRARR